MTINNKAITRCVGVLLGGVLLSGSVISETADADIVSAVAALHGISEEAALDRLAAESIAAMQYHWVRELDLEGYAGAWFDDSVGELVVAASNEVARQTLDALQIESVLVEYDMESLRSMAQFMSGTLRSASAGDVQPTVYVDIRANTAVAEVAESVFVWAEGHLSEQLNSGMAVLRTKSGEAQLSSGSVRAAEGTRNLTWADEHGGEWPCSIGAVTMDGYVWAGHCGDKENLIGDSSSSSLGEVVISTWWPINQDSHDSGMVETDSGWTLTSTVQGYSDGVFNVSKSWSGLMEFAVNSTVCRYGGTSGGPHCGTIDQKGLDMYVSGGSYNKFLLNLTRVSGSCSDDGDSGGPHVAGSAQLQGINVGVERVDPEDECPTQAVYVYFQPIANVLDDTNEIVRTPHGSSSPTIVNPVCPDPWLGGPGEFYCSFDDIESQGGQSVLWTSNVAPSSTLSVYFGTCSTGNPVNIDLDVTNPYGTTQEQFTFQCP